MAEQHDVHCLLFIYMQKRRDKYIFFVFRASWYNHAGCDKFVPCRSLVSRYIFVAKKRLRSLCHFILLRLISFNQESV